MSAANSRVWYDVDRDFTADFALVSDDNQRLESLAYDDDGDGEPDRVYDLADYALDEVPHLIILLDSIPFDAVREYYAKSSNPVWTRFHEPAKVIAPFPSSSALCFSAILHAPPMPGMINRHFDSRPQYNSVNNLITKRASGYRNPWQRRLHYNIDYSDNGYAWLKPRPWMRAEMERARRAFDASPDRFTIVYIASTSAMLSKYGREGLDEALRELEKFVLQVMYERKGAVAISILSDHGHNLVPSTWIDVGKALGDHGYRVSDKLTGPRDVFLEMDGLMTYFGVHTTQPVAVADALLTMRELELVMYMEGAHIVVRDHRGAARIRLEDGRYIYEPGSADVLGYGDLADQALTREQWLARTADHTFPDAPPRIWDAFHGIAVSTPQVMVTVRDGYHSGITWFELFIDMKSTHGGINQGNSAAFLMTMTRPVEGPLRSAEVLDAIEPGFTPQVLDR